jgi:lysozyme
MHGHDWTALFEAPNGKPILKAYPDPLTGGAPFTVGLGHTGYDVKKGETWTADRCMAAYYNDYAIAQGAALHVIGTSTWSCLADPRRCVLIDMAFNIGGPRLGRFEDMLAAIRTGDWQRAHDELLDSAYAKQVKGRAIKNANVLLTGHWPGEGQAMV